MQTPRLVTVTVTPVLCLLGACSGNFDEAIDGAEDPETLSQAVVGGAFVSSSENADASLPYGSTIRIANGSPSSGFSSCSGTKIGARRYLTAAHCVDNWNGSSSGKVLITNALDAEPTNGVPSGTAHTVTQVHVHPTWLVKDGTGNYFGRPLDIAMFDVSETNSIVAMASGGVPKINPSFIDDGVSGRIIGYGASGAPKKYGDNTSITPTGTHPFFDEDAMWFTHFFWNGQPGGEPGDSGAPVVNLSSTWRISGVVSGQGVQAGQSMISRTESALNWINNPAALPITAGSGGYLINADAPYCLGGVGSSGTQFFACSNATNPGASMHWKLEATAQAGFFRIRNGKTGKCLGTASSANQALAQQFTCDTSSRQRWQFSAKGSLDQTSGNTASGYSFYIIKNAESGRCLAGSDNVVDVHLEPLRQWDCTIMPANPIGHWQAWAFSR